MAKNRFNTRASWDDSFKHSGQLMPKSPATKKAHLSPTQLNSLAKLQLEYSSKMNDWERGFIKGLIEKGFKPTPKQIEVYKRICKKVNG